MEEKKSKKGLIALVILLLLLGGGAAAFLFLGDFGGKNAELDTLRESMDLEDLQDYLEAHPEDADNAELQEIAHDVKFQAALEDNEIVTYQSFLEEFPESEETPVIEENLDWLITEDNHSNEAFEAFITKYPDSLYIPRAQLRIGQNDFWTRTKPIRDRFFGILQMDDDISVNFYPQYAEYAAQLIAHDLIYEAAGILTVLQYHYSAGAMACLMKGMSLYNNIDFNDYYALDRINYQVQVLQAKSDVMLNLNYKDVIDDISDLAVSGDVEIDTEQFLLDQAGAGEETDAAQELENMLRYIQITPYMVMYPEFVGRCVDFLSTTLDAQPVLMQYLQAIHYPKSAQAIAENASSYAPSAFFNGLGVMATRFREDLLQELENLDDKGKAVLIYGFGIADDRRAEAAIGNILETTEDPRLKIACWYALTRFGRDHSEMLNTALSVALEEGGDPIEAADILTAYQWARDLDMESKINRDLLIKALDQTNETILFFALAIMEDLDVKLDNNTLNKVLELSRHEDTQVQERASSLLSANQDSLKRVMQENFADMGDNEKAMLIASLQQESFEAVETQAREFIAYGLSDSFAGDSTAKDQILGSVGTLGIAEHEDQLMDYLKNQNNFRAGLSLAMLYQDDVEGGIAKLAGLNSNEALVTRGFLGDESAINELKALIDSYSINDKLQGLNYSKILNNPSFYSRYAGLMKYSNSNYAPTDYYVAIAAQTAGLELLVQNKELRQEVRENL
ncbi:MAG: hypothetical protein PF447_13360 [Spirochaetaceae bacterium]|nr:hypothetical protein [Spirochaetaceae bacterium]